MKLNKKRQIVTLAHDIITIEEAAPNKAGVGRENGSQAGAHLTLRAEAGVKETARKT
jgi:hypothetical protein